MIVFAEEALGVPERIFEFTHGKSGYVALYEHSPIEHLVRVAAIRHQREAGYRGR